MEIKLRYRPNLAMFFGLSKSYPQTYPQVWKSLLIVLNIDFFKVLKEGNYLGCEQVYPQVVGSEREYFYERY
ncbi:MAG TPA: hypothetical protein DEO31_07590 [Streptococcus sp.]|nr:hypothetical protein [Streptococcus sp.]